MLQDFPSWLNLAVFRLSESVCTLVGEGISPGEVWCRRMLLLFVKMTSLCKLHYFIAMWK